VARADADVVIKLDVRDAEANASLAAFEARLRKLERSGRDLGKSFDHTTGRIENMSDSLGQFEKQVDSLDKKSLKSLDKELVSKRKDFDKLRNTVDKSSRNMDRNARSADRLGNSMRRTGKDGGVLSGSLKSMWKFVKFAGIEFTALSAAVGGLNLALKSGQIIAKGWQWMLKGIGAAAGVAVAGVATALAALREYQMAMLLPALKSAGVPLSGASDARSRVSGFMGASRGLGMFSDEAIQTAMSAAMANGQKINPQLFAMMRTLGNFTVGTDMSKTLPEVIKAFTAAQKGGGKITEDIYGEIASSTPGIAKVFEELAGGPKKLEDALKDGKLTVDQFMAAFKEGTLDSVKPFIGALDEVNNTLFGRFKDITKRTREQLTSIGEPLVESLKDPLETLGRQVRVFLTRITPVIQSTFQNFMPAGGGGFMDRFFRGFARLINENLPKIANFGNSMRKAFNWTKDVFGEIGDYIRKVTTSAGSLWENIWKPVFTEIGKTFTYALETLNDLIDSNEPFARNFKGYVESIGEGVRSLIDGLNNVKKVLAPLLDSFLRLFQVISQVMGVKSGGLGSVLSTVVAGGITAKVLGAGAKGKAGGAGVMTRGMYQIANLATFGMLGGMAVKKDDEKGSGGSLQPNGPVADSPVQGIYGNYKKIKADARKAYAHQARLQAVTERRAMHLASMNKLAESRGMYYAKELGGYLPHGQQVLEYDKIQKTMWYTGGPDGTFLKDTDEMDRQAKEKALRKHGGVTKRDMGQAAQMGLSPRRSFFGLRASEAEREAKAIGKAQGRAFLASSAKQFGEKAGPIFGGMALSALGGLVSSNTKPTDTRGQAVAGALALGGQGLMIGGMVAGPTGALVGGAGMAAVGAISAMASADKAKSEEQKAIRERVQQYSARLLQPNSYESIQAAKQANLELRDSMTPQRHHEVRELETSLQQQVDALFGSQGGRFGDGFMGGPAGFKDDSPQMRARYKAAGMRMDSWRGTDNIYRSFEQPVTDDKIRRVRDAARAGATYKVKGSKGQEVGLGLTAEDIQVMEDYLAASQDKRTLDGIAGKELNHYKLARQETVEVEKNLNRMTQRYNDNAFVLNKTLGLARDEASQLANTMNFDLTESMVNVEFLLAGLGYGLDEFANRATAAGRLLDAALTRTSATRALIESDSELDATGQRLFNTAPGEFESKNDATLAAADFHDALINQMTVERTTKGTDLYDLDAEEYAVEMQRRLGETFRQLYAEGADPMALAAFENFAFGERGYENRLYDAKYANVPPQLRQFIPKLSEVDGGSVGDAQDAYGTLSGKLANDEKFAVDLGKVVTDAAADAFNNSDPSASIDDMKQIALETIRNSQVFQDSGLEWDEAALALEGIVVGEFDQSVVELRKALDAGATKMADALKGTSLGVSGSVSGVLSVTPGALTAPLSFDFRSQGSNPLRPGQTIIADRLPGSGGGGNTMSDTRTPRAARAQGDTTSSRWAKTLGTHQRLNTMLPGRRVVTSGVRENNLGSLMSDHRFGRAYDLTGDNLGQYAQTVNGEGGFAEFHGSAGSRHLHVVPPIGDTMSPAMVGAGAGNVYNYSVSVSANTNASPNEIAETVIREIRRIDRSDRERR
jgi:hypothetical protein